MAVVTADNKTTTVAKKAEDNKGKEVNKPDDKKKDNSKESKVSSGSSNSSSNKSAEKDKVAESKGKA